MGLTIRQKKILIQVAKGRENLAIAHSFRLSVETIKKELQEIQLKLGARDRTHAVAIAMFSGIIE